MTFAWVWPVLIGTLLPAVTAAVTKLHAPVRVKQLTSALLAAITGAVAGYTMTPPHGWAQWEAMLASILVTWLASGASIIAGALPAAPSLPAAPVVTPPTPMGRVVGWIGTRTAEFGVGRAA